MRILFNIKFKYPILLLFFILPLLLKAQRNSEIDSLSNILSKTVDTKEKINILNKLCWKNRNSNPDTAIYYGLKAIFISDSINDIEGKLKALNYNGVAYRNKGVYEKAMNMYFEAVKLAEKHLNYKELTYAYINIGNIHLYRLNYQEAKKFFQNALTSTKHVNIPLQRAYIYINLGRVYTELEIFDSAHFFIDKGFKIRLAENDKENIFVALKYRADILFKENKLKEALREYKKVLDFIQVQNSDIDLVADIYIKMAEIHLKKKKYSKTEFYAKKSLTIAREIGVKLRVQEAGYVLADMYYQQQKYKQAFRYYLISTEAKDSLFSERSNMQISELKTIYETQKKDKENELLREKQARSNDKIKQQRIVGIIVICGLGILMILSVNLFRLNRHKKKANEILSEKNVEIHQQKEEITTQKEKIEASHFQITSSINYARRIQAAMLPEREELNNIFKENFVFYKPKDVVSGDFYWGKKTQKQIIITAADSTGHGVPGAFVSMLGISLLNEIVQANKLFKANELLNELRDHVKTSLKQTDIHFSQAEGMDMSLCIIDIDTNMLQFSGANNSLYIIPKDNINNKRILELEDSEKIRIYNYNSSAKTNKKRRTYTFKEAIKENSSILEIRADHQPIGINLREKPFLNFEFQLEKGDSLYMFSDGYLDQFNIYGYKFQARNFKNMLLSIQNRSMPDQNEILNEVFYKWKGEEEQVDDVLVLALKI